RVVATCGWEASTFGRQRERMMAVNPHEVAERARPVSRDSILALERALLQQPQINAPLFHHFAGGVYARELHIPKGAALTGKIHRFGHINVLLKGDITVLTEHGMQRLVAPQILI